jgi:hypothetical protein
LEIRAGCYAVHQVEDGWEIIAPSDDPTTPAYWRVAVVQQSLFAFCGHGVAEFHRADFLLSGKTSPIVDLM